MFRVVVFPHPEGPSNTSSSPSRISRTRFLTAVTPPSNCLLTSTNRMACALDVPGLAVVAGELIVVAVMGPIYSVREPDRAPECLRKSRRAQISHFAPLQGIDKIETAYPALEQVGKERRRNDRDDGYRGNL